MKPTFALDLTRDAIGLLHRTPKGWLSVGEVAFDAPDLAEALDYLRKTALGLSPMGVATKLILPNGQILYTEVHAPGPSRDEKRRQIAAALEGRTPYPVEDLVFDWSGKGATVKVAVVAKETLAEAEAFAVEHRLNPVSFVAIPEDGTFVGEPWFGPTAASAGLLAEDETVDRDREPVAILHRELPMAEAVAPADIPVPAAAEAAGADMADLAAMADKDEVLPGLDEALNAAVPDEAAAAPAIPPEPLPPAPEPLTPEIDALPEDGPAGDLVGDPMAGPPEGAGADAAGQDAAPDMVAVAAEVVVAATAPVEAEEAPFAHVTDTSAFPEADEDPVDRVAARTFAPDDPEDDLPPAPSPAALVAFASRRNAPGNAPGRAIEGVMRPAGLAAAGSKAATGRSPTGKGFPGLVTAPSIPGTRAKSRTKGADLPRPTAPGPTTVKSPARPGGTFGAAAPARKRTGIVFMVLVALLLLFLALIGLWSSLFLGGDTPTTDTATAVEIVPDVDEEMLADMQDPEGMQGPLPEAGGTPLAGGDAGALATESLPVNIGGDQAAADADPTATADVEPTADVAVAEAAPEAAPEPAPDTLVATDVPVATAPVEDQDEIFLSTMDAPPPALDALALPALADARDVLPDPPMPPPAPGTVYQFDAQGLLKPTAEGIVSPEGVFLIAGKPPLVPPARSDVASAAALAAVALAPAEVAPPVSVPETGAPSPADASLVTGGAAPQAALPVPADPALAGFRPRPRPESLVAPGDDDARVSDDASSAFAGLRPLARPAAVTTAAATIAPEGLGAQGASLTAQAEAKLAEAAALEAANPSVVAISMRPASRPRDLSQAVEAAVAAAVREPVPEEPQVEIAAAAPEAKPGDTDEADEPETASAAPSIPTKASVAKLATYKNAINLSKINLIGTYGTDSRRYALIRQSNGKYKKVQVGDRIDGGTIKAITETEVRYQKGGRLVSLKMPKA
jgi:hypothetical protein